MKEMTYGQSLPLYGINHILTPSTDGEIGPIRHNGMFRLRLPTTADAQSWCRAEAERWLLQQVQEVARRSHWLAMRIPGTIKCKDLNASWTRMGKGGLSLNWRLVFLPASAVQWIITRTIIDAMPYTGPTHQLYGKAMPRDYIERWRDTQMAYAGFAGNRGQQEFQKYAESAARALR